MANFFTNLISISTDALVKTIATAIDNNITSNEEKKALKNAIAKASMRYQAEIAALALKTETYLAETERTRFNQNPVKATENISWIAKNIYSLLAFGIVCLIFWMYWRIIFSGNDSIVDSAMKDVVIYILGALTTISTQLVARFFGSSQGSAEKSQPISDLAEND